MDTEVQLDSQILRADAPSLSLYASSKPAGPTPGTWSKGEAATGIAGGALPALGRVRHRKPQRAGHCRRIARQELAVAAGKGLSLPSGRMPRPEGGLLSAHGKVSR